MIVAGRAENLGSILKASALKKKKGIRLGRGTSHGGDFRWDREPRFTRPYSRNVGAQSAGLASKMPVTDWGVYYIGEQSREISGLHGTNRHSKVLCVVWRTQVCRRCVWMLNCRCYRCFLSSISPSILDDDDNDDVNTSRWWCKKRKKAHALRLDDV